MGSTHAFCTFYVDDHFFGVEVEKVQEVIRHQPMTRVPLAPAVVRGLINLRGQIVTALDLRRRLGLEQASADRPPANVVVRSEDGAVSMLVDEIGDVLEVDEDHREPPPNTVDTLGRDLIQAVYKLDGRLLLILDTERATRVHGDERC